MIPETLLRASISPEEFLNPPPLAAENTKEALWLGVHKYLKEFEVLLKNGLFAFVYQPIVSLRSGMIIGWEALIRGPEGTYFHKPDAIFPFAEESGWLSRLEKRWLEIALTGIGPMEAYQKIFLNVYPQTIFDRQKKNEEIHDLLLGQGLKADNIVLEITEKKKVQDYRLLHKSLKDFRKTGFQVAMDDVGAGFSDLQAIVEIRPNFIKIDMAFVRDIHSDAGKRVLLETFVILAEKINGEIIAEGIETENELKALMNIGVHCGQGYLIAKPAYPKPQVNESLCSGVFRAGYSSNNQILKQVYPIGHIAEEAVCVDAGMQTKDVKAVFDQELHLSGIVALEDSRPVGLIMRQHLDRYLGKRYGVDLYYNRPIHIVMDRSPLLVEEQTPIEKVSQLAMNREKLNLYDDIIVVSGPRLKGVVSVQKLLDQMTKIRVETAKGASPLTGLPGNISIEQELHLRHNGKEPFAVVFVDLDNFKSFNDQYGFEEGDRIILFTANLLKSVLNKYAPAGSFLGHIGGDDFILFLRPAYVEAFCRRFIRYFDRLIPKFYQARDLKDGKILGRDRDGNEKWIPVISVSLAHLDVAGEAGRIDFKEISLKVAQLKKYAKSLPGSVYVKDRREAPSAIT
jgi:EAL domain-containing protein (putative c-di-GMP-specific phosphodiesterase class I)/GGDEF domain-containing protein